MDQLRLLEIDFPLNLEGVSITLGADHERHKTTCNRFS